MTLLLGPRRPHHILRRIKQHGLLRHAFAALLATGYGGHNQSLARAYDNEFEPTIDVWLRILRQLYREGEPNAVTLGTVPNAKGLVVLLTHDIDYARSVENAMAYARYEQSRQVPATYFMQTKYVKDYNDDVFFNNTETPHLTQLRAMGMEVASHSVSHSRQFASMPIGSGDERYPSYHPFVRDAAHTIDGTVLGELRVSKFLIESVDSTQMVTAFRPGYLAEPRALPEALASTGYRYSSSTTADQALTHWPFELDDDGEISTESGIFEFAVSIEDEAPPRLDLRLASALDVAHRVARYGGEVVVLVHPNVTDYKLRFEEGFVSALQPTAWFGTVSGFGRWWAARDAVSCDATRQGHVVTLHLTTTQSIDSLPVEVPPTWQYVSTDGHGGVRSVGSSTFVVHALTGTTSLTFRISPGDHKGGP